MYLRNIKGNMGMGIVAELYQLLLDLFIVQEGKFIGPCQAALGGARLPVQLVIGTKPVTVQQLIYQLTTFAAKRFIVQENICIFTGFAAMVAAGFNSDHAFRL